MEIIAELEDNQYEFTSIDHTRNIARAFLVDEEGRFCLMHILCDDDFGHRDLYETPGGGVKEGESLEQAVLREIKEETGVEARIICPLGCVSDYYNLIRRHNLNNYFLLQVVSYGEPRLEDYEKDLFSEVCWLDPEEALGRYEAMVNQPLARLVRARELPVLQKAIGILKEKEQEIIK